VSINLDTWNSLSPELQQIFQQTVIDYEKETAKVCTDFSVVGEKQLLDAGVTVKSLSAEQKEIWCGMLQGWPTEMAQEAAGRGLPGHEVMAFYVKTISELGHEFPCEYKFDVQ